jgi:lipoyl(octanoyl) transferase
MRTGSEVAVFVTRHDATEVLLLRRSPEQGGYWHVVAGGIETGESPQEAARRELREETGLIAEIGVGVEVVEFANPLPGGPAERRDHSDTSLLQVPVTCYSVEAPKDWEPTLDWEHDAHLWRDPHEAFAMLRWSGTTQALWQRVRCSGN